MKRLLLVIAAVAGVVALPAPASARIIELGSVADPVEPGCPEDPCSAAVRVTGLQGRASGGPKHPYYIRRDGHIVAFTVRLGDPNAEQLEFFTSNFGSPSQVRLSVLRRGDTRRTRLNYRLLAQSQLFELDRYFGSSPTFVLPEPLRVHRGNWIAITVPTWAPMWVPELGRSNWWRGSRAKDSCDSLRPQFALSALREVNVFGCTYKGGRLLYTATYVPDPRPTDESGSE
jgi:hypothetical protein